MNIQFIESLLNQPKNKPFLIIQDRIISYKDFLVLLSKTISFLSKTNKKYIFINAEKNEFTLAAYFATLKLGKIAAFIDSLSKFPEKFVNLANKDGFYISNNDYQKITSLDYTLIDDSEQLNHNEMSEIIFTTGTTGTPKGVLLSHKTTLRTAININRFTGLDNKDIEIHMMPISHSFGLARIRCCILKGCTIVFQNGFGNLISFFETLEKYNGTVISTVPAGIEFLVKLTKDKISNYSSQIRMIELGSSPMSPESKIALTNLLPKTDICMHYGLTEASRSTFLNFQKDSEFIGSVGKANLGTEIIIVDEVGNKCKYNESGEICIKGTNLFSNYIFTNKEPEYYKEFFKTGDYGYLDKNGYLFFKGRKDEMMNIAGKKVSPLEIEKNINNISFIDDSACIQTTNTKTGLVEIKAFVVLSDDLLIDSFENKIKKDLKNNIEYYKIPTTIVNIASIPRSHNGKILRTKLSEVDKC